MKAEINRGKDEWWKRTDHLVVHTQLIPADNFNGKVRNSFMFVKHSNRSPGDYDPIATAASLTVSLAAMVRDLLKQQDSPEEARMHFEECIREYQRAVDEI
jgi:hypothetical protein